MGARLKDWGPPREAALFCPALFESRGDLAR
jgi:hypothetical protein